MSTPCGCSSSYRANPDVVDPIYGTPLLQASQAGRTDLTKWLLHYGANPNLTNQYGTTPLMAAAGSRFPDKRNARVKHPVAVRTLLLSGARQEASDRQGRTAMDFAVRLQAQGRTPAETELERETLTR